MFYDRLNGSGGGSLLKSKRSADAGAACLSPSQSFTRSSRPSTGMVRVSTVPVCAQRPSTAKPSLSGTWLRPSKGETRPPQVPACVGPAAALPAAAAIPAAAAGAPAETGVLPSPPQLLSPRSCTPRAAGDCARDRDVLVRLRLPVVTAADATAATAAVAAARDEVVASAAQAAKRATEAEAARQRRRVAEYHRRQRQRVQRDAGEVPVGEAPDWYASSLFTLAAARFK